jgi:hypothetical protein
MILRGIHLDIYLKQILQLFFRTLDYDEVRKEGGFKSSSLKNVDEIICFGEILTKEEKEDLISREGTLFAKGRVYTFAFRRNFFSEVKRLK